MVYICGILSRKIKAITIGSLMSLIPECFWPDINRNKKYNSSVFCSLHNKSESNKVRQNAWMWMVEEVLVFWVALSICLKTQFSTECLGNLRFCENYLVWVSSNNCLHKNEKFRKIITISFFQWISKSNYHHFEYQLIVSTLSTVFCSLLQYPVPYK